MTPTDIYILYGFLGFMSLMLLAMFGFLVRLAISVGRIEGQLSGLTDRVNGQSDRINGLENRIERLEGQMVALIKEVAEIKGMLISLHERVDLLMRHQHNEAGQVVIVPAEAAATADN